MPAHSEEGAMFACLIVVLGSITAFVLAQVLERD